MTTTASTTPAITSRAMVFDGPGRPLRAVAFPLRLPAQGEVRVRIRCCTVCGSDLHTYQGHRSTPTPTILGHEILGDIDAIGPGEPICDHQGQPLRVGDRVTWSIMASCRACFYCEQDLGQKCDHLFKYGHEEISEQNPLSGGIAEHCLLAPGTTIVRIPDDLPDLVACPANCATATVAAALRMLSVERGQTVLIQGLGALGLTALAMARAMGARHVIGCDVSEERLALARDFGATHAISPGDGGVALHRLIDQLTDERGVDAAVELSGSLHAMQMGLPLLRIGGQYMLVGAVFPGPDLAIKPEMLIRRMLTIRGLHNYGPDDLLAAVQFLAKHHRDHPFDKLVERVWPLHEAEDAFKHAIAHRCVRVAVVPERHD